MLAGETSDGGRQAPLVLGRGRGHRGRRGSDGRGGGRRRALIGTGGAMRLGRRGGRLGRPGGGRDRARGAEPLERRGTVAVDLRDLGVVGHRLAFLDQDRRERPGEGRGHLRVDLVGDDLDDRLVLVDVLPDLLEPLADGPLRHALAELGHRHLGHGSFSSRRSLRALPGCGTAVLVSRIRGTGAATWCVDAHPERVIALGLTAHGRSGTTGLAFEHAPACRWHARFDAARRLAHRRGRDGPGAGRAAVPRRKYPGMRRQGVTRDRNDHDPVRRSVSSTNPRMRQPSPVPRDGVDTPSTAGHRDARHGPASWQPLAL